MTHTKPRSEWSRVSFHIWAIIFGTAISVVILFSLGVIVTLLLEFSTGTAIIRYLSELLDRFDGMRDRPLGIILLPVVWASGLVCAYGIMGWSARSRDNKHNQA